MLFFCAAKHNLADSVLPKSLDRRSIHYRRHFHVIFFTDGMESIVKCLFRLDLFFICFFNENVCDSTCNKYAMRLLRP